MRFVARIEEEIIPRLGEIMIDAEALLLRTEERIAAGGDAEIAEQNRRANELTVRAAEVYTEYLQAQAASIDERIERLRSNIEDAELTYETLSLSGEVTEILRNGLQDLDALMSLQPPPMARLESKELQEEFRRISERIVTP